MKKSALFLLTLFFVVLVLMSAWGCKPKIRLPEDRSLEGNHRWLVVSSLYAQMKAEPAQDSSDIGILRQGVILNIIESSYSASETDRGALWFKVQSEGKVGWISVRDAKTFSTETQAKSAGSRMK
jgi:hypothetical protein